MTLKQAQALRVGDMVRYHDSLSDMETIEIVISEWGKRRYSKLHLPSVTLKTVVVINDGDDDDEKANIGDEGWINKHNHGNFEKIA